MTFQCVLLHLFTCWLLLHLSYAFHFATCPGTSPGSMFFSLCVCYCIANKHTSNVFSLFFHQIFQNLFEIFIPNMSKNIVIRFYSVYLCGLQRLQSVYFTKLTAWFFIKKPSKPNIFKERIKKSNPNLFLGFGLLFYLLTYK